MRRALQLGEELLSKYGYELNKDFRLALEPRDGGVFDVYADGQLIFSRGKEGRFPEAKELMKAFEETGKRLA